MYLCLCLSSRPGRYLIIISLQKPRSAIFPQLTSWRPPQGQHCYRIKEVDFRAALKRRSVRSAFQRRDAGKFALSDCELFSSLETVLFFLLPLETEIRVILMFCLNSATDVTLFLLPIVLNASNNPGDCLRVKITRGRMGSVQPLLVLTLQQQSG